MPYSEAALEAMQYNPVACRAYVWRAAMYARSKRHPNLHDTLMANIDAMVRSSIKRPKICEQCRCDGQSQPQK